MGNGAIKPNLFKDITASIVVFLIALPLCLGISLASGATPLAGIISGIVGGILVGYLSGSQISVSGPAAGLAATVAIAVQESGNFNLFLCSVIIAGLIQILFGALKWGNIGHFFPDAVIKGMLTAIGLLLILKQIPHAVGYDNDIEGDENFIQSDGHNTFTELLDMFQNFTPGCVAIYVLSVFIMILWEQPFMKKSKAGKIPGSLVVVFVAVIFDQWMSEIYGIFRLEPEHMVQMPLTDLKNNIQSLILFPLPEGFMHSHIWMNGIIIGVIASLETLLSIEAADKIDPGKRVTPLNRELLAQGFGNMVSGLIGGLPITSVVVRTSANVNSGATSRNSSVFHGVLLLISILFFPELLNMIPKSALAVILIFTGYKLAKPEVFKHAFKKGSSTYIPFLVTILAILFSDMLIGIGIGMFVGMIYILKNNVIRSVIHIESENNHLIKFIKDVTFFNKSGIKKILSNIKPHSNVLIDMGENIFVDNDILELIHEFKIHSKTYQIELEIKNNDHRL